MRTNCYRITSVGRANPGRHCINDIPGEALTDSQSGAGDVKEGAQNAYLLHVNCAFSPHIALPSSALWLSQGFTRQGYPMLTGIRPATESTTHDLRYFKVNTGAIMMRIYATKNRTPEWTGIYGSTSACAHHLP